MKERKAAFKVGDRVKRRGLPKGHQAANRVMEVIAITEEDSYRANGVDVFYKCRWEDGYESHYLKGELQLA